LIACTGWTWEYIDNYMTIPRLSEMTDYWADYPPAHVMIAQYFGIGKSKDKPSEIDGDGNSLFDLFPSG